MKLWKPGMIRNGKSATLSELSDHGPPKEEAWIASPELRQGTCYDRPVYIDEVTPLLTHWRAQSE